MIERLLVLLTAFTLATSYQFYRKDYTYFHEYDAFYKLHWDANGLSWDSAFMACEDEGAKLFYPKEEGEWTVVKTLTAKLPVAPNASEIFVGIHDEYGLGEYITVDGTSTPSPLGNDQMLADGKHCVMMNIESGAYNTDSCTSKEIFRPFVCKRIDDKPCPTIDRDYVYEQVTKKCYKVNNKRKQWQDAMHTCFIEGGLLVTIDSQVESKTLFDKLKGKELWYFIGIRRSSSGDFYTVKGQKLTSGYYPWESTYDTNPGDNCGAITTYVNEMQTLKRDCTLELPFVCEMKAKY